MKMATILIVEDDYDIAIANRMALELMGYKTLTADTLEKAREIIKKQPVDLIVLDILLPDGSGLNYCEELRVKSGVRILFLSALNSKTDQLAGLRAGGDDYITKPYDMDELILRIEALLRRGKLIGQVESEYRIGNFEIDYASRRIMLDGRDIMLKPKEFAILEILLQRKGELISSEDLYQTVWGMEAAGDVRTIKVHISRIRYKLGKDSAITIESEHIKGYRLNIK